MIINNGSCLLAIYMLDLFLKKSEKSLQTIQKCSQSYL